MGYGGEGRGRDDFQMKKEPRERATNTLGRKELRRRGLDRRKESSFGLVEQSKRVEAVKGESVLPD